MTKSLPGPAIANLVVKVVAVTLALIPLVDPDASHFAGKAMTVRALIYPWAALAIPAVWWARGRPRPYPYLADIALVAPFLLDAAGNVFGWFATTGFDAIPHLLGWLCLTVAFGLAVGPLVDRRWILLALTVGVGATIDIVWELAEYLLQQSGQSGLQLTYVNTIQDLATSLAGAIVGGLASVTILWPKPGTPRTVFGWPAAG
ncbi:MAG: hypothetical protein M3P84_04840 [Chloroflexota bacterium]|nr:hypothetical protein [Chloroflexota bacterium]